MARSDAPLFAQYLFSVRNDSLPASADDLLSQAGRGADASYALGFPGQGTAATILYEHCWDTGIEAFGRVGPLRYRVAVMEGIPGSSARKVRDVKEGHALEGRLTRQVSESLRLGGS